jgi:hypothetical protein
MIEIYVGSGQVCYQSDMNIEALRLIMEDKFIKPDDFINIKLMDGDIAYVKKSSILSFNTIINTV